MRPITATTARHKQANTTQTGTLLSSGHAQFQPFINNKPESGSIEMRSLAEKEDIVSVNGELLRVESLQQATAIHAVARKRGYSSDVYVGYYALVCMASVVASEVLTLCSMGCHIEM